MNDNIEIHDVNNVRSTYLIECQKNARDELLFRIKHRDNWLRIQLVAQITFLALAFGVEIGGVKPSANMPSVLTLSVPTAVIMASLYFVEDQIITCICQYLSKLSKVESEISRSSYIIKNLEASEEMREFSGSLNLRFLAQFVSFLFLPIILEYYKFSTITDLCHINIVELIVYILMCITMFYMIISSYKKRQILYKGD